MHTIHKAIVGVLGALILALPGTILAAESTSYRLYDEPGTAQGGPMQSTSYALDAEVSTWRALPGISTAYQLTLAPIASSSSSSSSSSTASVESDGASGGVRENGGGGRRGSRGIFTLPDGDDRMEEEEEEEDASPDFPTLPVHPAAEEEAPHFGETILDHPGFESAPADLIVTQGLRNDAVHYGQAAGSSDGRTSTADNRGTSDSQEYLVHPGAPGEVLAEGSFLSEAGRDIGVAVGVGALIVALASAAAVSSGVTISNCVGAAGMAQWLLPMLKTGRQKGKKGRKGRKDRKTTTLLMVALLLGFIGVPTLSALAATTAPQRIMYNGHLLDSNGAAVTSAVSVRFSFWNSADYVSGDVTGEGAINTSATTYASWNEVHTVTPNSQGFFSLEMGSVTSLPDFSGISTETLLSLYLQVEVKASSAANTAYELLDFDTSSTTSDRSPMRSVPFALNADFVDKREVGTGSGNIAILGPGAVFNPARMPGGTNSGTFLIDYDGSETSSATLQFGRTLGKSLVYDGSNTRFNFDDDVRIQGDLTVTGLINGINLATVAGNAPLKVSSGAGLNVTINAGSYRLNGSVTNYTGGSSISVTNNTTNYVFFGSGGLAISTIGFPTDDSTIRLAEVVTSGGAITTVSDRRVTSADDRERTIEQYYRAAFEDAAYKADGSNNVGQLSVTHDATSKRNHYLWTSTKSTLQDYDIYLRVSLGSDFISWVDNPLRVTYRSTTASAADNKLDIAVYDTAGNAVTLSGSTTSLANTSWTTSQMEFTGSPTFTAGQDFLVKFTVSSKENNAIHLGEATLLYRELLQ